MKFKSALGIVAGIILIASAFMHTVLGWRAMSTELAKTNAPADLVLGLEIDWKFGGPVMLTLGIIAIHMSLNRWKGLQISTFAPGLMAVMYTLFGIWAMAVSGEPFFAIFVVPGVLLLIASLP
jgi:hypothetical protein